MAVFYELIFVFTVESYTYEFHMAELPVKILKTSDLLNGRVR